MLEAALRTVKQGGALRVRDLLVPYSLQLAGGLVCLAGLAAAGAAYAFLSGPLLRLILGQAPASAALPWGNSVELKLSSGVVAATLLGLALTKGLAQLGNAILLDGTAHAIGHDLRARVYRQLLLMPLPIQRRHARGDLLARLVEDTRQVQQAVVEGTIALVRDGLAALALITLAIWLAPQIALVSLLVLPIVGLSIGRVARAVRGAAGHGQEAFGNALASAQQGMRSVREVKSFGAEAEEHRRFIQNSRAVLRWVRRRIALRAAGSLFNEVLGAAAVAGAALYLGFATTEIAPQRLVSFVTALLLLYRPMKGIGLAIPQLAVGLASAERLNQLLRHAPECTADDSLPPLRRRMTLEGIGFTYADSGTTDREPVLAACSMTLQVGEITALTGPSGAGKSTLANVVCGLDSPSQGRLLWDGCDITERPCAALRKQVALVPQQPLLLAATVAENLRYGAPQADSAAMTRAIRAVGLQDWLAALPLGLASQLGADADRLSVGEAQRLALARALLRRASVLVLDEPSSALDAQSERHVVRAIRQASRSRAVLVIAHGAQMLKVADNVMHLVRGGPQRTVTVPPRFDDPSRRCLPEGRSTAGAAEWE